MIYVIAGLNIRGRYLGRQYVGSSSPQLQTLDGLGLQLAAKLLVRLLKELRWKTPS